MLDWPPSEGQNTAGRINSPELCAAHAAGGAERLDPRRAAVGRILGQNGGEISHRRLHFSRSPALIRAAAAGFRTLPIAKNTKNGLYTLGPFYTHLKASRELRAGGERK